MLLLPTILIKIKVIIVIIVILNLSRKISLLVSCCLVSSMQLCYAESNIVSKSKKDPIWSGSIEYGVIATSGNTNTRTESAKTSLQYKKELWVNDTSWSYLKASDAGVTSADQMFLKNYTKYSITVRDYLFLLLHYERDRFSGYLNRTTEVFGYGFSIIKNDSINWDIELGAGARQNRRTDERTQQDGIARIGTNFSWYINKNSKLSEVLFMDKGDNNTFTESLTSVKLKINAALSLSLNFKVKNNSIVPDNIKHTDTQTTVNIIYDF